MSDPVAPPTVSVTTENKGVVIRKHFGRLWKAIGGGAVLIGLIASFIGINQYCQSRRSAAQASEDKVVLAVFPKDSATSQPMIRALNGDRTDRPSRIPLPFDHCFLEFAEERDTEESTARSLQKRLEDPNVVLVIGHERSTMAQYVIDHVYKNGTLGSNQGPVPLILPAVTNPNITKEPPEGKSHILRLPASDDRQVAAISTLLLSPLPKRVVLVVDASNRVYSQFIANQLIAKNPQVSFVDSVGVALDSDGFYPARFLNAKPDTIIFVGMEVPATIFLPRLVESPEYNKSVPKPRLIFTDGTAGDTFDKVTRHLPATLRVFLTAPFPTDVPKGASVEFPNYKQMGEAARSLALKLLAEAQDKGAISRANVLLALRNRLDVSRTEDLSGIRASFDSEGNNIEGEVHVYELGQSGPTHSLKCPCIPKR